MSTLLAFVAISVLPLSNGEAIETIGWRSEPSNRGTFRLLVSCITTLALCVYTALHLNIPKRGTTKTQLYLRKIKWVLVGIFAPEFVLYIAWRQWNSARRLTSLITELLDNNSVAKSARKHTWTMTHAFFAGMGGFVVDTNDPDRPCYIPNSPRLSVTANGIAVLAECGHLPDISREDIVDKSKADNVAKTLAILQGSWLLLQCIARIADGLPLTLLELNTLAHTICALAMYALWWNKPYDVHEPVLLSGDWVRPLSSAMWMFSRVSAKDQSSKEPEIESLIQVDVSTTSSQKIYPYRRPSHTNGGPSLPTDDAIESFGDTFIAADSAPSVPLLRLQGNGQKLHVQHADSILDLRNGEVVRNSIVPHDSQAHMEAGWPTLSDNQVHAGTGFGPRREISIKLSSIKLTRWHLALPVLESYPHAWYRCRQPCERRSEFRDDIPVFEYPASLLKRQFVVNEIATWPGRDLVEGRLDDTGLPQIVLLFVTIAYGGLHAAAWKDYFPSVIERWMWRVSSLIIATSGFTALCGPLCGHLCGALCGPLIIFVFYVASRVFLVVEALISLRQLPVAMYETPRFVEYIPHL